ncbi:MAG TPA: hypothetical protein VFS08_10810 [Gemmatimonadaceae bacterium]|nr:hypothetical protein [Gemmatimonadaceae bacterium]
MVSEHPRYLYGNQEREPLQVLDCSDAVVAQYELAGAVLATLE